ncbi:hypothetical protein PPYR_04375 [Photinus pyralis]|uniref:Nuclear receptor domain-containing protein n=1 Tax=Photinus pyralis TaxID=7054 RepID=A0A1Y1MR83_PHOPY|nr:nuclear receptor ROR-alpha B-like [Photinus pyralis]KAB0802189.1 hypothetical protein PPYR_04375 [Photinus pyralis]
MNQLCRVCGEPAAGFHFGAFTCEGCKSFFGRSYNNLSSISECKNNGECVINKKNRTACKACRLRKCLLVGMSKSGSRYGRRSNWFKIHCLLQQQQQAGVGIAGSTAAGLLRPHPYYRHLSTSNPTTDTKSSESDSGASSADPDDEVRSASAFSYFGPTISPSSDRSNVSSTKISPMCDNLQRTFPGKVPSLSFPPPMSPNSLFPRWLPTLPNITYPSAWRDLWLRAPVAVAEPAPEQDQPIDLSLRPKISTPTTDSESEINIDVGVEESVKHVPIDLSNSDKTGDITNN